MPIINNSELIQEIQLKLEFIKKELEDPIISEPFMKDFSLRFCWSSNAIEGNTLNLEETVSVIEYDEVRSGHTYTEYQEAKNLYRAIRELLVPFKETEITEAWIKKANGIIRETEGEYRKGCVYIGSIVEAVYYPPDAKEVPRLVQALLGEMQAQNQSVQEIIEEIARQHIQFERIHPFQDGNGRTGRMLLNQQMINQGLLPVAIKPTGKYRQAFRQYEKNGDISLMAYVLCKSELESVEKVRQLVQKKRQQIPQSEKKEYAPRL